jgi:hypothetical protein
MHMAASARGVALWLSACHRCLPFLLLLLLLLLRKSFEALRAA